jgi:phosphoesterase RecJ-like protein
MFDEIVRVINSCRNFLITSHIRLDGDAIGSELAMYHTLRNMGKEAVVYNQDETPEIYRFLPGSEFIVNTLESLENFDVVFVLDCSKIDRMGNESSRVSTSIKKMINIDHHISNGGFCDISLIDPEASSTGEILYRLFEKMGVALTEDMAINLYTAILTDTGSFRYSNTGRDTFTIAGKLVEKGANPQRISEMVYEMNPPAKIKLLTKVLETFESDWDGKISSIVVTQKMLEDTGALPEYTEGFVDFVRSIEGVEVAIIYNEMSENNFRISLRSKGRTNVERVAGEFGGGGHFNASACMIEGDIDTVKKSLVNCIINQEKR